MIGPQCGSSPIKKNGSTHNNKRKYQCNDGGKQLVEDPQNKIIDEKTKELIDKLLLEKIQPVIRLNYYPLSSCISKRTYDE